MLLKVCCGNVNIWMIPDIEVENERKWSRNGYVVSGWILKFCKHSKTDAQTIEHLYSVILLNYIYIWWTRRFGIIFYFGLTEIDFANRHYHFCWVLAAFRMELISRHIGSKGNLLENLYEILLKLSKNHIYNAPKVPLCGLVVGVPS
jgi:hypothetical protein